MAGLHTIDHPMIAQDKDAKIQYLTQLAAAVHAATGAETNINPAKVVAGLEPEVTNVFLQQLGHAAQHAGKVRMVS